MWKFKLPKGKDRWLVLLSVGVILCILAFPAGGEKPTAQPVLPEPSQILWETASAGGKADGKGDGKAGGRTQIQQDTLSGSYEAQLEQRVKDILKEVEGVGAVDVMIVLKSTGEKVIQVDDKKGTSVTEEQDTGGGTRKIQSQEEENSTVLVSGSTAGTGGSGTAPIIKKEMYPELSGIVITAAGGGNPTIQAEISAAMEALFGLPAHKIKVLKRAE